MLPTTLQAMGIVAMGLIALTCSGRAERWPISIGIGALVTGAALVVSENWDQIWAFGKPAGWHIGTIYSAFEAAVWILCALEGAVALALLAFRGVVQSGATAMA